MILESVIYEEELDSYENEILLEKALYDSNLCIDLLYFENTEELTKTEKFKAMIKRIIERFKAFINKCLDYLKSAIDKITGRVNDVYVEFNLKEIIKNFDQSINAAESAGMKTFTFIDMNELRKCIDSEYNEYTKIVKKFSTKYILLGTPSTAEKLVKQLNELTKKYDDKIKSILGETKEYSIREAKKVIDILENSKKNKKQGFTDIVDKYSSVCKEIEQHIVSTLNSLDKYSEDTGYIQNAKTLQEILHNTCIHLHVHSAECITFILKYGVSAICKIDKIAHTKTYNVYDANNDKIYKKKEDWSSYNRQKNREVIEKISDYASDIAKTGISGLRTVTRKNDVKDWKFNKGESPLSFDNRKATKKEIKETISDNALQLGVNTAVAVADISGKLPKFTTKF